ncbi:CPBP family intramembrane glutamic endopeptidase [Insolitispirillum peregrinum]|nr:CPBP family intramembrane glutamic endopeptidase [Insolitispirillum peregrinum]
MSHAAPSSRWAPLILAALIMVGWSVRVVGLSPWEASWPPITRAGADLALRWIILAVLPLAWAATVESPFGWRQALYPTPQTRPHRLRAMAACFGYWLVLLWRSPTAPTGDLLDLYRPFAHDGAAPVWPMAALLAQMAAVAVIEETLFRGYFLNRFTALWGFSRGAILQAALFAAIHLPGWLWGNHLSGIVIASFALTTFAYGLIAAVAVRWGGILLWGYALHLGANLLNSGAPALFRLIVPD